MIKKIMLGIIFFIVLIAGGLVYGFIKGPDFVDMKVEISGKEGLRITGTYTLDGVDQSIEETLPATIAVNAKRLSLSVGTSDTSENIFAEVFIDNDLCVGGANQYIKIDIRGKTLFSAPKAHLTASNGPLP